MSDNWVVQNLENALEVWNGKLRRSGSLSPNPPRLQGRRDLGRDRGHPRRAPGHRLRPVGVVLCGGRGQDLRQLCGGQKPEHALKLFVRFALAKALITYGMELMLALLDIIQGVVSSIMNAAGFGAPSSTVLPAEIVTAVEDCGFLRASPMGGDADRRASYLGPVFYNDPERLRALFKMYMYAALAPSPCLPLPGNPARMWARAFSKATPPCVWRGRHRAGLYHLLRVRQFPACC